MSLSLGEIQQQLRKPGHACIHACKKQIPFSGYLVWKDITDLCDIYYTCIYVKVYKGKKTYLYKHQILSLWCKQNRRAVRECKSPGVGPQASLYPVAPGTLFHETTAALVLTADTLKICTALLSTDTHRDRVVVQIYI